MASRIAPRYICLRFLSNARNLDVQRKVVGQRRFPPVDDELYLLRGVKPPNQCRPKRDQFTREEFNALHERINKIEERTSGIDENTIQKLEQSIYGHIENNIWGVYGSIEKTIKAFQERVKGVEKTFKGVQECIEKRVEGVEDRVIQVERTIEGVEGRVEQVDERILQIVRKVVDEGIIRAEEKLAAKDRNSLVSLMFISAGAYAGASLLDRCF